MRCGVVEFGEVAPDTLPMNTIRAVLERAVLLESLGYNRIWLGEHHRSNAAWASPDQLVGAIAAGTTRIVVGTGCVLLKYRDPYRLAADFRLLAGLYPGRIELGVGSGVVGEPLASILGDLVGRAADYEALAHDVAGFLAAGSVSPAPHHGVHVSPVGGPCPDYWMMGASEASATLAGRLGAHFCYALFTPSSTRSCRVVEAFRCSAIHPGRQHHAVALAAAWYSRDTDAAAAPPVDGYAGSARLSYSGHVGTFAEWLQATARDFCDPDILILNRTIPFRSLSHSWTSLSDALALDPGAARRPDGPVRATAIRTGQPPE